MLTGRMGEGLKNHGGTQTEDTACGKRQMLSQYGIIVTYELADQKKGGSGSQFALREKHWQSFKSPHLGGEKKKKKKWRSCVSGCHNPGQDELGGGDPGGRALAPGLLLIGQVRYLTVGWASSQRSTLGLL